MDNMELKSFPFCGGKAKIKAKIKRDIGFTVWCECEKCHANTSGYFPDINKEDNSIENIENCKGYAIERWNNRV